MVSSHPVDLLLQTLRFGGAGGRDLSASWASADLGRLDRLVEFEGCEIWFYRRLRALDLLESVEPDLVEWLAKRARGVAARNMLVDAQASATKQILDNAGIPSVFLKGVARRLLRRSIPYADARALVDVDVLVPGDRAQQAWQALISAGFEIALDPKATPKEHYHLLPLVNSRPITVEIHFSTSQRVDAQEAWRRQAGSGEEVETELGRLKLPSATELFWHTLTHLLGHGSEWFRLRSLLDLSSVWASEVPVDWEEICARLRSDEVSDAFGARLWLGAAQWLAAPQPPQSARFTGSLPQVHLRRLLVWRMSVLSQSQRLPQFSEKLLEESARAEFRAPLAPMAKGVGPLRNVRRRVASLTARATYLTWRARPR